MPSKPKSHAERERERKGNKYTNPQKEYDERRRHGVANRVRQSKQWRKLRKQFAADHPLCADPFGWHKQDGVTVPMAHVHHIIPIVKNVDLAYDKKNLMAVCVKCHNKLEREIG
jgi:5-methylcytosine-specific restriction protein A